MSYQQNNNNNGARPPKPRHNSNSMAGNGGNYQQGMPHQHQQPYTNQPGYMGGQPRQSVPQNIPNPAMNIPAGLNPMFMQQAYIPTGYYQPMYAPQYAMPPGYPAGIPTAPMQVPASRFPQHPQMNSYGAPAPFYQQNMQPGAPQMGTSPGVPQYGSFEQQQPMVQPGGDSGSSPLPPGAPTGSVPPRPSAPTAVQPLRQPMPMQRYDPTTTSAPAAPIQKREKKLLFVVDPNTKDVIQPTDAASSGTGNEAPVSNSSEPAAAAPPPVPAEPRAPSIPASEPVSTTDPKAEDIKRQFFESIHAKLKADDKKSPASASDETTKNDHPAETSSSTITSAPDSGLQSRSDAPTEEPSHDIEDRVKFAIETPEVVSRRMSVEIDSKLTSGQQTPGDQAALQNGHPNGQDASDNESSTKQRLIYSRDKLMALQERADLSDVSEKLQSRDLQKLIKKQERPAHPPRGRGDYYAYGPPPPNRGAPPQQKVIDLKLDVEYKPSENAWERLSKKTSELSGDDKVLFDVRALLNKLTPQNVDKLTQTLLTLGFNENEERLTGSVDLMFEKALDEPHYAETYAKLCRSILHVEAKSSQPGGPPVKLRTVLLQRAQKYFEQTDKEVSEATKEDKADSTAEDKAAAEQKAQKARRRYLGNIRFISELYKAQLLTGKIILHCYQRLQPKFNSDGTLSAEVDEEKLESLAKLLMSTGQQAEADAQAKDKVSVFFAVLQKLIDMRVTSSRLRFLMQDAIDVREKNYVDDRAVATKGPKTIKEIHDEKEREKQAEQRMVQEHRDNMPGRMSTGQDVRRQQMPPMAGGARYSAGMGMMKKNVTEPNNLAAYGQRGKDGESRNAPTKHQAPTKFLGALNRAGQPTLGPGGMTPRGSLRPGLDNRSAASSRESSLTRGGQAGRRSSTATPTLHQPDSSKTSTPAVSPPPQAVTDDEFHKCIVHMEGVVNAEDEEFQDIIERASSQVLRMSSPQKKELIPEIFNKIADSKDSDRKRLEQILPRLTRLGCFDRPDFVEGLGSVIDLTEDLAMDVPQIYQIFIAHIAGPLLIEPGAYHLDIGTFEEILQRAGSEEQIQKYKDALLGWVKSESPAWSPELKETLRKRDAQRWPQYLPSSA